MPGEPRRTLISEVGVAAVWVLAVLGCLVTWAFFVGSAMRAWEAML